MMAVTYNKAALDSMFEGLGEDLDKALRPAAQAGAQVFYEHVRMNATMLMSSKGHWFHGTSFRKTGQKYWFEPGTLRDSIYQVYSKDNSTKEKATYHIAWNHQKCPYGFMVEFGTRRAPAQPFLNPAWASREQAAAAVERKLGEMMQ